MEHWKFEVSKKGPYLHRRCNVSSMKYVTCFGVSNEKTAFIEEENTLIKNTQNTQFQKAETKTQRIKTQKNHNQR